MRMHACMRTRVSFEPPHAARTAYIAAQRSAAPHLRLLGGGHHAGADGPHRLVSNDLGVEWRM